MSHLIRGFVAAVLFAACQSPSSLPPATPGATAVNADVDLIQDYEVVDLGNLGQAAMPHHLNDLGVVVGSSNTPSNFHHAFWWEEGVMRDIEPHECFAGPGLCLSAADVVNNAGRAAGRVSPTGIMQLAIWEGGALREITGGWGLLEPSAINAAGHVLANASASGSLDEFRAIVWRDGRIQDLGVLVRAPTLGLAINARGQVVGHAWADPRGQFDAPQSHFHPFIWENGVMRDLGVLSERPCPGDEQFMCGQGFAEDINDPGHVVGYSEDATGAARAVRWYGGRVLDLGVRLRRHSVAVAINNKGQIVGNSDDLHPGRATTAWLWERGVIGDLGSLGGGVTRVSGINERGDVIGQSLTASGETHAFVWRDGRMTDLGAGAFLSGARAVNERGDIIGVLDRRDGRGVRAILWRRLDGDALVATSGH